MLFFYLFFGMVSCKSQGVQIHIYARAEPYSYVCLFFGALADDVGVKFRVMSTFWGFS